MVRVVRVPVQELSGARGAADVARGDEDGGDHRRADARVCKDLQPVGGIGREGETTVLRVQCALQLRCRCAAWGVCGPLAVRAPRCVLPVRVARALVEKKTTALMPANCWKTKSKLEMATSRR